MTKQEFLTLCESRYPEIVKLDEIKNFYEFEKQFEKIMHELSRTVLESTISQVPADRRKKKTLSRFGKIEIANAHGFSEPLKGYQISPYMQELMTYAGQLECYGGCNEVLSKFLCVEVSVMQVHRVTNTYGNLLEQEVAIEAPCQEIEELKPNESVYAMTDGSMILTREDGWNETKLGRIFKESDCMEVGGERGWIRHSVYEAYLGDSRKFTHRFEQKLDVYRPLKERLIFITDGAVWIKNWITDAYPGATQILDWFHAIEHLCEFAKEFFGEENQRCRWIESQKELLYDSKIEQVIANITQLPTKKATVKNAKKNLLQYYQSNKERMDYKKYRSMGAGLIGSGAIESAHRTVIQKRMKLSGQRWTKKRAQNMLTLRCVRLSEKWNKVIKLICNQAKAA